MKAAARSETLPVAVIGAGPIGLAAAAELATRDISFVVLEAAASAGSHVTQWRHVRMFSPWRFNMAKSARRLLNGDGWVAPDDDALPTGGELVDQYLAPLAATPALSAAIRYHTRVTAISRLGLGKLKDVGRSASPFLIRHTDQAGEDVDILARAVIDCSGTWSKPAPAGHSGLAAQGEKQNAARIAYGMPDVLGSAKTRYAGKRVAVLGSGHSAIGTLLDLVDLRQSAPQTGIVWLLRQTDLRRVLGGGTKDGLPARGALGMRLSDALANGAIRAIHPFALERIGMDVDGSLRLHGVGGNESIACDELVVATGFRPDLAMLGEIRLDLDPATEAPRALAPLIDPNVHSCGTVRPHGAKELAQPEPGFYLAGMKSYGRAPTFLMATGYEQVRSIVAEIAGDHEAAARVELELPETGVCSTDFAAAETGGCCAPAARAETAACCTPGPAMEKPASDPACCGGRPKADSSACCVEDEIAKVAGKSGCGCSDKPASASLLTA
jgi:glycine/D-amino acid oxidase-like deaminating enzyme